MSRFLGVSESFPTFSVPSVVSLEKGKEFAVIDNEKIKGRWSVFFFWPMDFTFVCPTEIAEFNKSYKQFLDRETDLFGASTDSQYVHLAWRQNHEDLNSTSQDF